MSAYLNLVGLEYVPGKQDCYSIVRRHYQESYGVRLRNYARPDRFWEDASLDLYQMFRLEGAFEVIDSQIAIGDVLLMPLFTPFATHACVVVGDNLILHHPPGRLSCVEQMRPKWSNRATQIIRHPDVFAANQKVARKVHLHEVVDAELFRTPEFQSTVGRLLGTGE